MLEKNFLPRILIGVVLFLNLQAAVFFILNPGGYAAAFELSGVPGVTAVQGVGVLFLMWNVPYLIALWDPFRQRTALYAALAMQAIGVLGESLILAGIPPDHAILRGSILRFIIVDLSGLLLLVCASLIIRSRTKSRLDIQVEM